MSLTKFALVIGTFFLICPWGHADFKYTQSGQSLDVPGTSATVTTTYVKDCCLRIDLPDGSYGIVDIEGRREIQVDPRKRTYIAITLDEIRARNRMQAQQMRQLNQKSPPPTFGTKTESAWTGRTRVFLGQSAREMRIRLIDVPMNGQVAPPEEGGLEVESWIAPAVMGFAEIRRFYKKLAAAIGSSPLDLVPSTGSVELMVAMETAEQGHPYWVPMMAKGILDLYNAAETGIGLPMLQMYGMREATGQQEAAKRNARPHAVPNRAASPGSVRASSANGTFSWSFNLHVTAYSAEKLDKSLFQVPAGYVESQSDPRNMWVLAPGP